MLNFKITPLAGAMISKLGKQTIFVSLILRRCPICLALYQTKLRLVNNYGRHS